MHIDMITNIVYYRKDMHKLRIYLYVASYIATFYLCWSCDHEVCNSSCRLRCGLVKVNSTIDLCLLASCKGDMQLFWLAT